uniref:CDC42 effector protein 1 n=1 Tax=Chelonoidis abingdonii TaxID=106734 RepID=A0A8C0G3A8_CHEAB
MSLGKLPVLGWVSGSHGKRRLKSELTPDMISPPLGDFRHTMHVGRGGDVFGDTSFLSNHGAGTRPKPRPPPQTSHPSSRTPCRCQAELQRSDSLLSFRLDLGPSLMSELLQVISFTEAMDSSDKREDARALAGGQAHAHCSPRAHEPLVGGIPCPRSRCRSPQGSVSVREHMRA